MLHGPDDVLGQLYGSSAEHQGLAEVEAESVAYTVLKAHGIDRGPQSFSYSAGWADAVIEAEADSIVAPTAGCKLLSRTDIVKSVLGRVTSASRTILQYCPDEFIGGMLSAVGLDQHMEVRSVRDRSTCMEIIAVKIQPEGRKSR